MLYFNYFSYKLIITVHLIRFTNWGRQFIQWWKQEWLEHLFVSSNEMAVTDCAKFASVRQCLLLSWIYTHVHLFQVKWTEMQQTGTVHFILTRTIYKLEQKFHAGCKWQYLCFTFCMWKVCVRIVIIYFINMQGRDVAAILPRAQV